MKTSTFLFGAAAAPLALGYELAVYWGAAGSQNSLATYCASSEGIDIMILAFLNDFGNGVFPSGNIDGCQINGDGSSSGCDSLASDIDTCKSLGKKVLISLGGANTNFQITSSTDATSIAYSLWNSFANPAVSAGGARPFGDTFVDGWDFDIESNPNNESQDYLGDLVSALRGYFSDDTSNTYYISGAPQCPLPEGNMGNSMMQAEYDYLFIQFYNNNCGAGDLISDSSNNPDGAGSFNLGDWPGYLSSGASASAKLHVGLPGGAATAGNFFFIQPEDLPQVLAASEGVAGFNGIMLYDAASSDTVSDNGCNYAQECRHVLDEGSPC